VSSEQFYGKTSQAVGRVAKRNLVVLIYELTRTFPKEETYGLISQMVGLPYQGRQTLQRERRIDRRISLRIICGLQLAR